MPDAPRPSAARRIATLIRSASPRIVAVMTLAAVGASAVYTRTNVSDAAPQRAPDERTWVSGSAAESMLSFFGLPPSFGAADGAVMKDIVTFAHVAGQPTPEPTPIAVLPAPAAAPTFAPPPRQLAPPPAAPIEPTAVPALATSTPVPSPPPPPAPPAAPSGLDTSAMDGYAQALFEATNRWRASSGLAPLRANGYLNGIARIRSQDMAANNYFAHTSPITGHTAFSLMDTYGVPYAWAGENLAKNNYPDDQAVGVADEALWNSPGQREIILGAE